MTSASRLRKRDNKKRKKCGWGPMAFIGPKFPTPKTQTERAVRRLVNDHLSLNTAYLVHIYDVVEAAEKAYRLGRKHKAKESEK